MLAMVTNKLAGLDIGTAKACEKATEAAGHWRMGLERARWCLRVAIDLERQGDIVFAASHTLQAAAGFGDFEAVTHAAQSIVRKDVWDVLGLPPHIIAGFITATQDSLSRMTTVPEDQQTETWKTAVTAIQVAHSELQAIHDKRSQA